jgi:hypothetical protein
MHYYAIVFRTPFYKRDNLKAYSSKLVFNDLYFPSQRQEEIN